MKSTNSSYDSLFADGFDFEENDHPQEVVEKYFRLITPFLPSKKPNVVLEIGCGTGLHLGQWLTLGMDGVGFDLSREAIELAKNRLEGNEHLIALVVGDILDKKKIEPLEGQFPLIVSHKHFPNIFDFSNLPLIFSEVHCLLSAGGIYIFDYVFHIPEIEKQLNRNSNEQIVLRSKSEMGIELEICYNLDGFYFSELYSIATQEYLLSLLNNLGCNVLAISPWIENKDLNQPFAFEALRSIVIIQKKNG